MKIFVISEYWAAATTAVSLIMIFVFEIMFSVLISNSEGERSVRTIHFVLFSSQSSLVTERSPHYFTELIFQDCHVFAVVLHSSRCLFSDI
jgi:hypothetical protein